MGLIRESGSSHPLGFWRSPRTAEAMGVHRAWHALQARRASEGEGRPGWDPR